MLKYIIITLLLGVYCALSVPTLADNPQQVLDTLKAVDAALNTGYIIYDTKQTVPTGLIDLHIRLDYMPDGRYHQITSGSTFGRPQSYEVIYNGHEQLWVSTDAKMVDFMLPSNNGAYGNTLNSRHQYGRGLSGLSDATVRQDGSGIHLIAIDNSGLRLDALLDQTRAYLAKEITATDRKGNFAGAWHFSSPHSVGQGVYVAMRSTREAVIGGKHLHGESIIREISISQPEQGQFTYDWLKPGFQISDHRLGTTDMGIFQSGSLPPNTTPAQLLEMSRQQIASRAKLHAADEANKRIYDQQNATKLIAVAVVLACLAFIAIAAAIIWKKRSLSRSR